MKLSGGEAVSLNGLLAAKYIPNALSGKLNK